MGHVSFYIFYEGVIMKNILYVAADDRNAETEKEFVLTVTFCLQGDIKKPLGPRLLMDSPSIRILNTE